MSSFMFSEAQQERIARFAPVFRRYLDDAEHDENMLERQARLDLYAQLLAPAALRSMTELEFGQVISSLWASRLWGNKGYLVDKLIQDNGLPALADGLRLLLWGREPIPARYDAFRRAIRGLGASSVTELLTFVHPEQCGLWNDIARKALDLLGFRDDFPALRKTQITGSEYAAFNDLLAAIRAFLSERGVPVADNLDLNSFLYAVWENGRERTIPPESRAESYDDFDHDDVVDQLVAIGQWLGFRAEKEKLIARGARVDVVWQARVSNLGVVTYVFEVQRRGSIDSLILNLQRSQNNPTVQRLIVVAGSSAIERIRQEIEALPEGFRKSVGFMEVSDAVRAAELMSEFSGIISKLELVRGEFGV